MSPGCGISAVRFARSVVENETGKSSGMVVPPEGLSEPKGAFVTLRTFPDGGLRGCIGIPLPIMPLYRALEEAARGACHDPRFSDLGPHELDNLTVEVTILVVPRVLDCPRGGLPSEIVIGRDGLIISYRGRRGLLLPQVPGELGWDVMEYLEGLCMKAGLPRGTWKDTEAEISSFGGKVFHEAEPYGDIREG
jgi:uncharacterized protein (TIGR00296 family)